MVLRQPKLLLTLAKKVGVADFVKPSPAGTTWGLGGTCVNVGCIPKKLMHISSLYRDYQGDMSGLGWDTKASHSWDDMVTKINNYIKSIQYGSKTELKSKKIQYDNAYATFVDAHTLQLDDGKGKITKVTADKILVACGGRPNLGGYPGAEECCISSDDIFWRKKSPGKTLVVGASYIALECAGFIAGLGFETEVMVRSILLRGFDQECAGMIGKYMESHHIKFARGMTPSKFEKVGDQTRVYVDDKVYGDYDTVLLAIGRTGCANELNLSAAGVNFDAKSGKITGCKNEQTNVENIYAVGDVLADLPELTPVAIQAGRLLMKRLFGGSKQVMDYTDIATTVFTPIEYGAIGMSEEEAKEKLKDNLIIYHGYGKHLEWNVAADRADERGYFKFLCDKSQNEKVVGVHILSNHCGELIQGLGVAMKAGFTKAILDDTVGIHPTFAEGYTTLTEVKQEGKALADVGGC